MNVPLHARGVTLDLLRDLVEESYRIVAPKRLVTQLDRERCPCKTRRVPGTTCLLAAIVFVLACPAVALADEGPTLLPGEGALVKRTHVTCTVTGTSVTCTKTGALTATLVKGGKVHVTQGSRKLFAKRRQLPLGLDGGFSLAGAPIYCHVYAAPAPTITCSTIEPAGGLSRTYGFDMSDKSVVVFRYGMVHDRHDLRSFRQG